MSNRKDRIQSGLVLSDKLRVTLVKNCTFNRRILKQRNISDFLAHV